MDILNWLYLAKNKFVRTTLSSTKDLMIFGAKVGFTKRGDKYQNYAMSAEDFTTSVADVVKPYKVYTALLTQRGTDDPFGIDTGLLTIGVTYYINNESLGMDFTNVGAPNNNVGTYFVATGTTPNSWGAGQGTMNATLTYNTGAPVVTVLENTIGDIWFTFASEGAYLFASNELFIQNKSTIVVGNVTWDGGSGIIQSGFDGESVGLIVTSNVTTGDAENNGSLLNTLIEIRVYN